MRRAGSPASSAVALALACAVAGTAAVSIPAERAWAADPPPPPPAAPAGGAGAGAGGVSSLSTPGSQGGARPWAAGVPPEKQQAALDRLIEGNQLLKESLYQEAAKKYREALAEWDHPGIHYNLALVLLNLDQPLEVHEHLVAATKYGDAPLDADKYERAQSYLRLVTKQLAQLEVLCELNGASVNLDGQPLFVAPGSYKGLVRPGPHTVTATKEGYPTTERSKILLPGEPTTINLRLYTEGELIEYRRRWPLWRPVAVAALGAAIIAGGIVFTLQARDKFDQFDERVRNNCASGGCIPDASLNDLRSQGNSYEKIAAVAYITGGLALAGGVALLFIDRSVPYRIDPEGQRRDVSQRERERNARVTPFIGLGSAGLQGTF